MTTTIKPTIGRKVWYWFGKEAGRELGAVALLDQRQAFDATIVFVHPVGTVNLVGSDHRGKRFTDHGVRIVDPSPGGDQHGTSDDETGYATWMPYQIGQAKP